jgi:hypothetical protein
VPRSRPRSSAIVLAHHAGYRVDPDTGAVTSPKGNRVWPYASGIMPLGMYDPDGEWTHRNVSAPRLAAYCYWGARVLRPSTVVVAKNGNRCDLRKCNLRLTTKSEVARKFTPRPPTAVLTQEQAEAARAAVKLGWADTRGVVNRLAELGVAVKYNVVWRAVRGQTYVRKEVENRQNSAG